jgi:transcriptional regulator with XRE-family HTH domain
MQLEFFSPDEIPELFARSGWTQKELAEFVGATPNTIGNWIKGKNKRRLRPTHRKRFLKLRRELNK